MLARPLPRPPRATAALITLAGAATAAAAWKARNSRMPARLPPRAQNRPRPVDSRPAATGRPATPGRAPYGTGRGPGSHLCPANGCHRPISADRLMCRPHWYHAPKPLRDAVWATWRSGTGTGTPEHTKAILAAITAASTHHRRQRETAADHPPAADF